MREIRKCPTRRKIQVENTKRWRFNIKYEIFSHYSNGEPKCNKCNYGDIRALCLDHVNNDGAQHRRKLSKNSGRHGSAFKVYVDVKRRGFPKDFQVLCFNCNRIKEWERINA